MNEELIYSTIADFLFRTWIKVSCFLEPSLNCLVKDFNLGENCKENLKLIGYVIILWYLILYFRYCRRYLSLKKLSIEVNPLKSSDSFNKMLKVRSSNFMRVYLMSDQILTICLKKNKTKCSSSNPYVYHLMMSIL